MISLNIGKKKKKNSANIIQLYRPDDRSPSK